MTCELAQYIGGMPELSMRIWLFVYSKHTQNGTSNVYWRDLMSKYYLTKKQIMEHFNPKHAESLGYCRVLVEAETFISINFKKGSKQKGPGAKELKLLEQEQEQGTELVTANVLPVPKKKVFEFDEKFINLLLGDYIHFRRQRQVDMAALMGHHININEVEKPRLGGEDRKHIKELVLYFNSLPKIQASPMEQRTDKIRETFMVIYTNWWCLNTRLHENAELRMIKFNINKIIEEIKAFISNYGKKTDKREQELGQKLNRAKQKDYSHLARTRTKGD